MLSGNRNPRRQKIKPSAVVAKSNRPVRSNLEKYCVEYFDAHGITFVYEPLMLLAGRQYRPDFYLPQFGLFLEICGFTHMPFYVDRMEEKRRQYREHGLRAEFLLARSKPQLLKQIAELVAKLQSKRD